jgi:D-sedoheptulose 7-phosphate isomerase
MELTSDKQMVARERAIAELLEGSAVLRKTADLLAGEIVIVAEHMINTLRDGKKIMVCGNGGSAADAQHFAAEIVGRFRRERSGWAAIALTVDASILTSLGNDFGFEQIFSRQVEALGQPGDMLFAISTSGTSKNVLAAAKIAGTLGIRTVGLTGAGSSPLGEIIDHHLPIPSSNTAFIQQGQMAVIHTICELVEERLTNEIPPLKNKIGD